jgi:hypothetical protein
MGFMDLFKKTAPRKNPARRNPPLRTHVQKERPEVILREMIEEHGLPALLEALADEVVAAGEEVGLSDEDAGEVAVTLGELADFCSGEADPEEDEDEDEGDDEDEGEDDEFPSAPDDEDT